MSSGGGANLDGHDSGEILLTKNFSNKNGMT